MSRKDVLVFGRSLYSDSNNCLFDQLLSYPEFIGYVEATRA